MKVQIYFDYCISFYLFNLVFTKFQDATFSELYIFAEYMFKYSAFWKLNVINLSKATFSV